MPCKINPTWHCLFYDKKIRSLDRTDSNIPIFAMSANAYAEDMEQAQAAGMTGYLTKPINLEIWLKEIRTGMG